MIYIFAFEVCVPSLAYAVLYEVALVDDEEEPCLAELSGVAEEIFAVEEERIAAVDYLSKDV